MRKVLGELMSERVIEADYLIIGAGASAMAFADEILSQQKAYLESGGHFIIPIPELKVI